MQSDDHFRETLERRIVSYRETRAELAARVADLTAQLEDTDRRLRSAESLYAVEFGGLAGTPGVAPDHGSQASMLEDSPDGPLTGLSWNEAIARVLADASEGLHVRDIWSRLSAGGFRSDARDPLRSIAAVAVREPRLTKVRPNTFVLASHRLPGTE